MIKRRLNISLILSFTALLFLVIWSLISSLQYNKTFYLDRDARLKLIELCETGEKEIDAKTCESALQRGSDVIIPDTVSSFFYLIQNTSLSYIQYIAPLLIFIISAYDFFREYSTGFYRNKLTRLSYKQYVKSVLKKAYKNIWIFPVWLIILFIISYCISGNFDYNRTIENFTIHFLPIKLSYYQHFIPFIIVFITNIILNSMFYVHLSLIPIKRSRNFIVCILSSFLIFLFWDICFEVLIGGLIFEKYLHISQTTYLFNLFNYWVYSSISNLGLYIGINIFYVLLSLLIVILIYHKKENVVIASES